MDTSQIVSVLEASRDAFSSAFTRKNIKEAWEATTLLSEDHSSIEDQLPVSNPFRRQSRHRNSGDDLLCWGGYEVVKLCLFLTNRATHDSTLLGYPKPFLVEIAFSGILLCIFISRRGHAMGGGYTLSTTILHYNFWKRRGSFLGLSECRGFLEVLYLLLLIWCIW